MARREPTYRWDERAARYRDARGRFVPQREIRRAIDRAIANSERSIQQLGRQFRAREISLDDWELGMRREIKRLHLSSAAAAKGGWAQMSPADYGRVGQITRAQYKFLGNFADQIAGGLPLDGRFLRRVELYAQAGRGTFEAVNKVQMIRAGYTEERNILGLAEHCSGCVVEYSKGWQPIGTLVPIGQRDCLSRCKCSIEYR